MLERGGLETLLATPLPPEAEPPRRREINTASPDSLSNLSVAFTATRDSCQGRISCYSEIMKLEIWLEKNRIPIDVFAERVGVHRSSIYRFIKGLAYPRKATMDKIRRQTKGQVNAEDFIDTETKVVFQSWLRNNG